jgi:hypothetical protein
MELWNTKATVQCLFNYSYNKTHDVQAAFGTEIEGSKETNKDES